MAKIALNVIVNSLQRLIFGVIAISLFTLSGYACAADTVTYYYTDTQGSVLATADAQGNVLTQADRRPYGEQAMGSPQDGPGFTGHVSDIDSGLVYMQARYYDPQVGRFLSVDPMEASSRPGDKFNRYWYANNNPALLTDPTGMDSVGENIDENAMQAVAEGSVARGYGWAFAAEAWKWLGNEELSQWVDKGSAASGGDKVMAVVSVVTLGKGSATEKGAAAAGSGVYRIAFSNGKTYIGKGLPSRMMASVKRLLATLNSSKDAATEAVHVTELEAKSIPEGSREAFKEESRMIEEAGGPKSKEPTTDLLNEIDSPGTKYRAQDGE
jgi:RHS repeat-associated protein